MKSIFQKSNFPEAPGGNLYEWKSAETAFEIPKEGLFAIKITASAKNAEQNRSKDDDDLRVALDGFDFGKYGQNREGSWKGFNVSSSWNGATLKGGTKTVYFFVNLEKGRHVLQFFADETPILKSIEIFEIISYSFELYGLRPPERLKSARIGIPWLSFVFLGTPSKNITLGVATKSAKTKGGTDGDNLKVIINGRIFPNIQAPASDKYKNFYFSGDLKEFNVLSVIDEQMAKPLAFENAVELWYDEEPEITDLKVRFFSQKELLEKYDLNDMIPWISAEILAMALILENQGKIYSAEFLRHSMGKNPEAKIYGPDDPIARKIKADPAYRKILEKLKEKIKGGNLEGEIWPDDFKGDPGMKGEINFSSFDLDGAIHGTKKIEYSARKQGNDGFEVHLTIFDIYDFEREILPGILQDRKGFVLQSAVNWLDRLEALEIIHNFEIEIRLTENIHVQ
ncbi:hypothetical protein JXA05_01425 [Candidatus Peregrinibacteria bacterium]|nr:hypothetical protein [Candidatus Peregrinibacteria bacterium]